jgi:hypothetical protein
VRTAASAIIVGLLLAPAVARAGESACWIEGDAVVVPAVVAGVPGDYILDTGTPHTQLHETRAQGAGFVEVQLTADIGVAGLLFPGRPVEVANLDARTGDFPTPIAGVIGADALAGQVLDLRSAPCRVGLYPPAKAPRFQARASWPLRMVGDRPTVHAVASDGRHPAEGQYALATGSGVALQLDPAVVRAPVPKPDAPVLVRALSVFGELHESVPTRVTGIGDGLRGAIGLAALAGRPVRIDLAHGRLSFGAQQKGPPDRSGGPGS